MLINGKDLLDLAPIKNMETTKVVFNGVSYGLSEAGYDIRIKQTVRFYRNLHGMRQVQIIDGDKITDLKGRFTLASGIEEFCMPGNLTGVTHDKSTWAREGLSVFNTVIEPGWRGFLTLELVHKGNNDLIIEAGSGIAQVLFHINSRFAEYNGKYQDQANQPIAAIRK